MRALLAFDKFKDCMTAADACAAAAGALRGCEGGWSIDSCPLTDGGEGFAAILTPAVGGELRRLAVTGPRGEEVAAQFGLVSAAALPPGVRDRLHVSTGRIAIIEMAAASGLALLPPDQRDVWQTTTRGTGELIRAATAAGAEAIVLGVGGSATNDLGLGALESLGLALGGNTARSPTAAPADWPRITRLGGTLSPVAPLFIACDVTNPLLGARGAAAVYGPQKGLRANDVARLDHESARMALMLCGYFNQPDTIMDTPGAGAAGGIAFGLMVALNARLLAGFEFVGQWLDVDARIAAADIVITGEGRFDESSLSGKGPAAIVARAIALGKTAHVFAGEIATAMSAPGLVLHEITPPHTPLEQALRDAPQNLAEAIHAAFPRS